MMNFRNWALLVLVATTLACGGTPAEDSQLTPRVGESSFVSADNGWNSQKSYHNNSSGGGAEADPRLIEKMDVFQMTESGLLLNFNAHRGLQVIDLSNPGTPVVSGVARLSGTPVAMFQSNQMVYLLLNDWVGLYEDSVYRGAVLMMVDISDPRAPIRRGHVRIPGLIRVAQLVKQDSEEALYAVVLGRLPSGDLNRTVMSFMVTDGQPALVQQEELNPSMTVFGVTQEYFLAATTSEEGPSSVLIIDISSPSGNISVGTPFVTKGFLGNWSVKEHVLRAVSHGRGSPNDDRMLNHVETFDITNPADVQSLDSETVGSDSWEPVFLDEGLLLNNPRSIERVAINPSGTISTRGEIEVPHQGKKLLPVLNESRLIRVSRVLAQDTLTLSIHLYDADLDNPSPLLAAEELDLAHSYEGGELEAVTILEDSVDLRSTSGAVESHLILISAFEGVTPVVEIYSFSPTTLTKRGRSSVGSLEASFPAEGFVLHNTGAGLVTEDLTNPDAPVLLGELDPSPVYIDFFVFGDHGVRRLRGLSTEEGVGGDLLQIVGVDDPNSSQVLAEIPIPASARVGQMESRLAVLTSDESSPTTTISVWDLTLPDMPILVGIREYEDFSQTGFYYDYYDWQRDTCLDCFEYRRAGMKPIVLGKYLVIPEAHVQSMNLGDQRVSGTYPAQSERYSARCADQPSRCVYYNKTTQCSKNEEHEEVCGGGLYVCVRRDEDVTCDAISEDALDVEHGEEGYFENRVWNSYHLHIVDLGSDTLGEQVSVDLGERTEVAALVPAGESVFVSYKVPHADPTTPRQFVKYYVREIDLGSSTVSMGPKINVPDQLVRVDGSTLITWDFLWGKLQHPESSINRLEIQDDKAVLKEVLRFPYQKTENMILDGAGHVILQQAQQEWASPVKSTIVSIDNGFTVETDMWSGLGEVHDAVDGHILSMIWGGGMVVGQTSDPTQPRVQTQIPMPGWPQAPQRSGRDVFFAAGPYGIVGFNLDAEPDLLPEPGSNP